MGTGPFRLGHWDHVQLHLEAYPDYFAGPPHLEGITIRFLDDDEFDAGAARFDRGELDVLQPATEDLDRLSRDPEVRVYRYQELSLSFLGLLTGAPPLDDDRVRQAVACAIDRESMAAQSPAVRRLAAGILPPGMPAYSPRTEGPGYDPERSRRLLEEAGYPGGQGFPTVTLMHNTSQGQRAIAEAREQLAHLVGVVEGDGVQATEGRSAAGEPAEQAAAGQFSRDGFFRKHSPGLVNQGIGQPCHLVQPGLIRG